jgi:hypothetical protein
MRRIVLGLIVLLAMIAAAERRLSDGAPQRVPDPTPSLWGQAVHPDRAVATSAMNCPLVMSLERESRYALTSLQGGIQFDIDADGDLDRVSWTEPGSDVAFLALDRDGDGRITSGKELIGGHGVSGATNGPNALSALAQEALGGEQRAMVDSRNPLFFRLLLWTDGNHNGVSELHELRSAQHLVSAIGLGFSRHHRRDRHGNESRYRGFVYAGPAPVTTREQDLRHQRPMYDVCLVTERSG